jgi:Beta/Gamma crystallin
VIRNQNQITTTPLTGQRGTTSPLLNNGPPTNRPLTPNTPVKFGSLAPHTNIGSPARPAHPAVLLNNRYVPIIRSQYFLYLHGVRKYFIPASALGVAYIGASYWDPDGYVSVLRRYCSGISENGCTLHWRVVDFTDGGSEQQCVQYCPHSGPPPAKFAELPPPPPFPPATASCQLSIFAEPNFGGASAASGDDQATLAESGWQNAISSIQIRAGTWDFFTDANFGGATMRLLAGPVPSLPPDWDKKIGSFQCVQRGPAA